MTENFNYIAFGDRGSLSKEGGVIQMSRGRMFEYTPTDIEKRLEDLGPASINFLEQIPTFLCSEIERRDGSVSMIIKFGEIRNTSLRDREIASVFKTLIDFGDVEFDDVEQARELFGADKFQLYRTHWAVREGNAQEILNKLILRKPNLKNQFVNHQFVTQSAEGQIGAEPPPRTKNIIGSARSVEEFLQILYRLPSKTLTENFFRGHENAAFEMTPSLLRKWPDGAWKFMQNEDRLCKELIIAHYDEFQGDHYCFDRLVRMQHYGLPTRLLDISGNPLVALFFACYGTQESLSLDGEVIIFQVHSDKVKYYNSDTVSCISNLSNLTYNQKSEINLSLDKTRFNRSSVAKKLLHHIKSEKGFFESRIVPDDIGSIVCVKAKKNNMRIKSQSGAFLLFGHEAVLSESGREGLEIFRVTIRNKQEMLDQLDRININATTVYPSIDQTAFHLKERYLGASSDY